MHTHRTVTQPSTATAVVTVDPVSDEHRALYPRPLTAATHVIAVRRGNVVIDCELAVYDATDVGTLRARAPQFAAHWGYAYFEPCSWCGINCTPTDRVDHERLSRGNETTWRAA